MADADDVAVAVVATCTSADRVAVPEDESVELVVAVADADDVAVAVVATCTSADRVAVPEDESVELIVPVDVADDVVVAVAVPVLVAAPVELDDAVAVAVAVNSAVNEEDDVEDDELVAVAVSVGTGLTEAAVVGEGIPRTSTRNLRGELVCVSVVSGDVAVTMMVRAMTPRAPTATLARAASGSSKMSAPVSSSIKNTPETFASVKKKE